MSQPIKYVLFTLLFTILSWSFVFSAIVDVSIVGLNPPYYSPGSTAINVGDTIRWTNNDSSPMIMDHTVVDNSGLFNSGNIARNSTFQYTYLTAGMFPYHCDLPFHGVMKATTYVSLAVDTTPPNNVTNFKVDGGDAFVQLGWTNPSNSDFAGTRIRRKVGSFPSGPNDGTATQIFQSTGTTFVDSPLSNGVSYYYGAYSFDTGNNFASGSFGIAIPHALAPPSISKLPDIRLVSPTESLDSAFNLNEYNRGGQASGYLKDSGPFTAGVDSQGEVNYGTFGTASSGTVIFYVSNGSGTSTTSNIVKYSTYRFNSRPIRAFVYKGQMLNIDPTYLPDLITPSPTGPVYFKAEIIPANASDSGKVIATISDNTGTISLTTTAPLNDVVRLYLTVSPDSTFSSGDEDTEIISVHEVLNDFGFFDQAADTTHYAYESAPGGTNGRPTVSWLSTFNGVNGVVRYQFSTTNQGVKVTLGIPNWLTPVPGEWYTLRMKVASDNNSANSLVPTGFIYNGVFPNPSQISGVALFGSSTGWANLEISVQAEDTSALYPQFTLKNGSTIGSLYLDRIQVIRAKPGILLAHGNTHFGPQSGEWNTSTALSGWAVESPAGSSLASYSVTTGLLDISVNGTSQQGIKMTGISGPGQSFTQQVSPDEPVGMQMKVTSTGTLTNPLVLLALFGTNSPGNLSIGELGATAGVFRIPSGSNGIFRLGYNVIGYPYVYPQFQIKNSNTAHIYVDDTFILIDKDLLQYWDSSLF